MANYKRRRPRTSSTHHCINRRDADKPFRWSWMGRWPRWWDIVFHTRPQRRREQALLRAVILGRVDPDEAAWPVPKKPHRYYW